MKQVIVMRKDLNMRKGKMIAQGAHAVLQNVLKLKVPNYLNKGHLLDYQDWIRADYTKITVSVNSEEELLSIYKKAKDKGLVVSLIKDKGFTEFKGVETFTCLCIGPHKNEDYIGITDELKLL